MSSLLATALTAVQQAGGSSGHGSAPQEHGAEAGAHAGGSGEWGTQEMIHHVTDSQTVDLGFATIDLGQYGFLNFEPIHVLGATVDLSVSKYVVFLFVAAVLTILTMWYAARQARRLEQGAEAPGGLLNGFEAFYFYLRDEVALANIGRGGESFVPLVVTLFFFILYANLLGLVPFGATATSSITVTGALAFVSLVVIEYSGYQALGGRGYARTIFYIPEGLNPVMKGVMAVIMPPVEVMGKLAKPFALAVRLFANMTAGHFVLLALLGLIVTYGSFGPTGVSTVVGSVLLGLFVMFLEIFVAFLHAYIFTMLTAVFIGLIRYQH